MKSLASMNTEPLMGTTRSAKYESPPESPLVRGCAGTANDSTLPFGQLVIVSLMGRSTAKHLGASSSRVTLAQSSSTDASMTLSALLIPTRSQNSRRASGVYPRLRSPATVGKRGSSHPDTWWWVTSWMSFRLLNTVNPRLRRLNSICLGRSNAPLPYRLLKNPPPPPPPFVDVAVDIAAPSADEEERPSWASRRPEGFTLSMVQSYKGRWSANSRVHKECVMASKASQIECAKSYMGYTFHLSPVSGCVALRIR
mmetsp:Transcript_26174/g.52524  ORF Transcript_26174/g.52524 Transcript_26174/m.52524 type:complete len:255 (+) Transcript_26174:1147-1911(+)